MKTFMDFAITLLNRDHFSQNQTFVTKAAKFTSDAKSKPTIFPLLDPRHVESFFVKIVI